MTGFFRKVIAMNDQAAELLEKIRQQFENTPYPRNPIEHSPKGVYDLLFIESLVTSYYLKYQRVIDTKAAVILDAGCGTGYTSLVLAEANPGAKIVGVDLSEESIKLAEQRLKFHGFDHASFYAMPIENLPSLGLEFDYISCDEVLYLMPDIVVALQAMKSVLKPTGVIRANLHSSLQRSNYFRAQQLFRIMGLMDDDPGDLEIEIVIETMKALKDPVALKRTTWDFNDTEEAYLKEQVLLNYLLQGDKGYTIPELFAALRAADLELLSMVNWREWELIDLFKEPDNLPIAWQIGLSEASIEQRLHLFELLHPVHRLLDFWCILPNQPASTTPVPLWSESDWQTATVHLHPVLKTDTIKADLIEAVTQQTPFSISRYLPNSTKVPINLEPNKAACLLPLWEGEQSVSALAERWLKIRPFNPVTLEPMSDHAAFTEIKTFLSQLEVFLYVLLQTSA